MDKFFGRFDDYEDDDDFYGDYDDDDENGNPQGAGQMQGFIIGPNGYTPMSAENLLNHIKNVPPKIALCTIFNGQYELSLVDILQNKENDFSEVLMECTECIEYKGKRTKTFLDAYEYLSKSHFINFVMARKFGTGCWAYEAIDLQMQIVDNDKTKYSKIVIMATSSLPNGEISEILDKYADAYHEKSVNMISDIPGVPLMVKVCKSKCLDAPIMHYEFLFGFNDASPVTFDDINMFNFYNQIFRKYIEDAIRAFYPFINDTIISKYGERIIRIYFEYSHAGRMLDLKMSCVPAYNLALADCVSLENLKASKYLYFGSNIHGIGHDGNPQADTIGFLNQICSSKASQHLSFSISGFGRSMNFCEDYTNYRSFDILCTLGRYTEGIQSITDDPFKQIRIFSNFNEIRSKFDECYSYWKPTGEVSIKLRNSKIKVYGFVNLYRTYLDGKSFKDINDIIGYELKSVLNLDKEPSELYILYCYESDENNITRVLIWDTIEPTINPEPPKKKRGLFGGGKK